MRPRLPNAAVARTAIAGWLLAWTSLSVAAQPSDEAREDSWIPVQSFVLDNGFAVHVVQRSYAQLVSAGWVVKAGSADDPVGKGGLAHLVEHLLFQGTDKIGTKDWERERELLELEDRLTARPSAGAAGGDDREGKELAGVRRNLARVQKPGELAKLWADGGFLGTGALTTKDFSFYTATFPPERLEAWFWLESDRINRPAMRGLQREKGVVREEELQRAGGGGRGAVEAAFDRYFWGSSPYHRPTDGEPGEMESSTWQNALDFHAGHYQPRGLALAIVGNVSPSEVQAMAQRYFGSMEAPTADEEARLEFKAVPEGNSFRSSCACRPSVRVRFPAVAYGEPDSVALDVLAAVLNGRGGRLYTSIVSQEPAVFAAYATHKALARSGSFTLVAEAANESAAGDVLSELRALLLRQLGNLSLPATDGGLSDAEVERARNVLRAEAAREVKESDALRTRLLIDAGLGDADRLAEWPQRLEAVTVERLRTILSELLKVERGVTFFLSSNAASAGAAR